VPSDRPSGSWRTINGAKVFINGGKVVAGLNGFNDHIDKFFSEKKAKQGESGGGDIKEKLNNLQNQVDKLSKTEKLSNGGMSDKYYKVLNEFQNTRKEYNKFLDKKRDEKLNSKEYKKDQELAQQKIDREEKRKQRENEVTSTTHENWLKRNERAIDKKFEDRGKGIISSKDEGKKESKNESEVSKDKLETKLKDILKEWKKYSDKNQQPPVELQQELTKTQKELKLLGKQSEPKKEENKETKDKPVNERSIQEISEAKQKIADTMPKPINKMTWEEFKPYGVKMQKESSHSQPDSWYERQAKHEHDWAIKNDKSQYDTSKIKGDSKKEEKVKLSPKAMQTLKDSKRVFLGQTDPKKLQSMIDQVKTNIGIDKNGKEKIGMGLDEDMVAAGNAFLNDKEVKDHLESMTKPLKEPKQFTPKEENKPKPSSNVPSKSIKDLDTFSKQKLDNEKTETISKLSNLASKIDEKYLSTKTKDKLNKLVEDIYVEAYTGLGREPKADKLEDKLYQSKNIKESLSALKQINNYLAKDDRYALESGMVDKIQDVLVEATKEQLNKETTEKKNYKLF
jgi:hypothetical protein